MVQKLNDELGKQGYIVIAGNIYADDIEDLRKSYDGLWSAAEEIMLLPFVQKLLMNFLEAHGIIRNIN